MRTAKTLPTPAALREEDAAHYTGYSRVYLKRARRFGTGPAYLKCGRAIRYMVVDLDRWLEQHRVGTSDAQ